MWEIALPTPLRIDAPGPEYNKPTRVLSKKSSLPTTSQLFTVEQVSVRSVMKLLRQPSVSSVNTHCTACQLQCLDSGKFTEWFTRFMLKTDAQNSNNAIVCWLLSGDNPRIRQNAGRNDR